MFLSHAGKPFCFGHPSVDYIADRFLSGKAKDISKGKEPVEAQRANMVELNKKHLELTMLLEAEKVKREALEAALKENWAEDLDGCSLEELENIGKGLEGLRRELALRRNHLELVKSANESLVGASGGFKFDCDVRDQKSIVLAPNYNNSWFNCGNGRCDVKWL